MKALSVLGREIRALIEEEQKSQEIRQIKSKMDEIHAIDWRGSEFADFCSQILVISQFVKHILRLTIVGSLEFFDISDNLAKLPRFAEKLSKFKRIFDPRAPHWGT